MTAKNALRWLVASMLAFVVGVCLHSGFVGIALILAGISGLGWIGASLAHPWMGSRVCYRVRYHLETSVTEVSDSARITHGGAVLQGLCNLAGMGGAVSVIWSRQKGELVLFMEVPASMAQVFEGMLPRLLPQAQWELTVPPPFLSPSALPSSGRGFYSCPLTTAGSGGPQDPFAFEHILADDLFTGDLQVRVNLVPWGANVVVCGTPGPTAACLGIRPLFRPLWRWIVPAIVPSRANVPAIVTTIRRKEPRVQLLRSKQEATRTDWLGILLRRYPLWEGWPHESLNATSKLTVPTMRFPTTNISGTTRLDSVASSLIPLPSDYADEEGNDNLLLGRASADHRPILVPLVCHDARPSRTWHGHFLVLGEPDLERDSTVSMLRNQVLTKGGGLVLLDPSGEQARRVAAQLTPAERSRRYWLDIENPAGSVRLNLLAVPPVAGRSHPMAGEAAALVCALCDCVPLLGEYLSNLGVTMWGARSGSNLLLDWARVLLISHHRRRLITNTAGAPAAHAPDAPDMRTLYELLDETESTLPSLVAQEKIEWHAQDSLLADSLCSAGDDGIEAASLVRLTLKEIGERLSALSAAEIRLLAAGLRDQLRPALHHAALSRLWRGPFEAPATLLNHSPGPVLLARLPLYRVSAQASVQGSTQVSVQDDAASRWYGSYLAACVVAAGLWRKCSGQGGPPVLVVLQDAGEWLRADMLRSYMRQLGHAGIAVLAVTSRLPVDDLGTWLLDNTATWWIHSLHGTDTQIIRKRLEALGVTADLPLSSLPPGIAVLKFQTPTGTAVATAYTSERAMQKQPT